jgi:hypothetical protein
MAVVMTKRHTLRGKIRQQCQYSVKILKRLVKAYIKSGEVLPIATGLTDGNASVVNYNFIIAQLEAGLLEKT